MLMTVLNINAMAATCQNSLKTSDENPTRSDYPPMFEIGKEWRYQLFWEAGPGVESKDNQLRILKVDGTKVFDGQTYYVVNAYTNNATIPDLNEPYGYFRENIEERKVYFRPNPNYGVAPMEYHAVYHYWPQQFDITEVCIYDFKKRQSHDVWGSVLFFTSNIDVYCNTGILHGYHDSYFVFDNTNFGYNSKLSIVERIGFLMTDSNGTLSHRQNCQSLAGIACDLLGIPPLVSSSQGYVTLLYSVVDGNGNEILSIDGNRLAGTEAVAADRNGSSITITADRNELRITAPFPIGDVEVFNPEGKHVYHGSFSETQATVSTAGFPPGIYMVKACGSVKKTRIAR